MQVDEAAAGFSILSPDGTILANLGGREVRLWNARSGRRIGRTLHHGWSISSIDFSPDGRVLAIGGGDDTARLWDTRTGEPIGLVLQNRDDARLQAVINVTVAFSPNGTHVATASSRDYARVWDASNGAPAGPVLSHRYGVYRARFSPDSRRLVTASLDRTARIWTVLVGDGTPATAALLADVAELTGGFRLGDRGTVVTLDAQDVQRRLRDARATPAQCRELQPIMARLLRMRSGSAASRRFE